jgi:hypothetical protein
MTMQAAKKKKNPPLRLLIIEGEARAIANCVGGVSKDGLDEDGRGMGEMDGDEGRRGDGKGT